MQSPRSDFSRAQVLSWTQLRDAAREPSPEAWWAAQQRSCLVLGAADVDMSPAESAPMVAWLRMLPCPVIALAPMDAKHLLIEGCDVRTARAEEVDLMVRNCEHSPLAALAFVQVLRVVGPMSAEQGLLVESLAYATLQAGPEFLRWQSNYVAPDAPTDGGPAVRLERQGHAVSICLNRPLAHNALNIAMRDGLVEAFDLVSSDQSIVKATVSGHGRCYSVGGDLHEFGTRPDAASAHRIRSLRSPALSLLRCAQRVDFRLHGACLGSGIELPAFGRRIVATRDAYFQLPELKLGLIPGSGGCISLPKRIGRQRTALLVLTGRRFGARDALAWGLVDELID